MKKILVIDDEVSVRNLLGRFLKTANYEVFFAEDGLIGMESITTIKPDLVLVDINMPNLDGITLCSMVKKDPALAHTPILMITGNGTIGQVEDALKEGPDGYLAKPFDLSRLLHKIESLLK